MYGLLLASGWFPEVRVAMTPMSRQDLLPEMTHQLGHLVRDNVLGKTMNLEDIVYHDLSHLLGWGQFRQSNESWHLEKPVHYCEGSGITLWDMLQSPWRCWPTVWMEWEVAVKVLCMNIGAEHDSTYFQNFGSMDGPPEPLRDGEHCPPNSQMAVKQQGVGPVNHLWAQLNPGRRTHYLGTHYLPSHRSSH